MKNNIANWTHEKPTEEGLYLACRVDSELPDDCIFIRVSEKKKYLEGEFFATLDEIKTMRDGFKFARLCVGSECDE